MSLLDFFRKKLLGEANVMQPSGFEPGVNTQGLFGQGGEFGGGLLQSNLSQMNQGENGLLGNIPQAAILGSAIYGQGVKGKDPLEAFFPAAMQTASFTKAMQPKKTELQKNLEAAGYKAGTPEYKAALNAYLNKGKTNTLSKEALNLYKQGQAAGDNFKKWFDGLNKAEKDLYNKQVKPNQSNIEQFLEFSKEQNENLKKTAVPIPMVNGQIDLDSLNENVLYNLNGQLLVWNGEKLVPPEDIKR
jgi:hypothetical protein